MRHRDARLRLKIERIKAGIEDRCRQEGDSLREALDRIWYKLKHEREELTRLEEAYRRDEAARVGEGFTDREIELWVEAWLEAPRSMK